MKKILAIALLALSFSSCDSWGDYESRLAGVKKVCPTCLFKSINYNGTNYYAIDTAKQPNLVYIVVFKNILYPTSTVDYFIKIN